MAFPVEKASMQYLKWDPLFESERPFDLFMNIPLDAGDQRVTNITFERHEVEFHDIRGCEQAFELDAHGFIIRQHQVEASQFSSKEAIESLYLPEVDSLLIRELDQVDRVCVYDWRLRHGIAPTKDGTIDLQDRSAHLCPANYAHVDTAPISALNRVRELIPNHYERLFKGRVRVMNVWRPITSLVEDWPLAVCDGSTVNQYSLVEADVVRRDNVSSNMFLTYDQGHKWYYLQRHRPDEALIFKQFDTRADVNARHCPHGAFQHGSLRKDTPPRQSIEVRALVFSFDRTEESGTAD